MSEGHHWIAGRTPSAPKPLSDWMDAVALEGATVLEGLRRGGFAELDRAREEPGRVRASAFHLLAADALLTYACEAALDTPDPRDALRDILRTAGGSGG